VLGTQTSTLDSSGDVLATFDMSAVTIDDARRAVAEHLVGDIEQIPPMVSAIRVDGKRLHELAREGIEVERDPRPVTIHRFEVADWTEPGVLAIEVECSAGTYIRTLADDLGRLLGGGAHLRNLRRTHVGAFTIAEAGPPDECGLLPVASAVRSLTPVTVDDEVSALVANGRVLDAWDGEGPWAVFDAAGELLAVYEAFRGQAKPSVVLPR
jgi:tRNA pseudouridine55 synthase